jgi:pimeloyl-ACP methyl ester carboxylesterase
MTIPASGRSGSFVGGSCEAAPDASGTEASAAATARRRRLPDDYRLSDEPWPGRRVTTYRPRMARAGLTCGLVAAVVVALAFVSGAAFGRDPGALGPATTFEPCASLTAVLCANVSVPLDDSGTTPGTLRLFVAERPAVAARGTILLLAGGPGEASAQIFNLRSSLWRTLFPGYTIAAYDNRGTGDSQALSCDGARSAAGCANAIGRTRVFYGTRENVEDMEAVRRILGVDRIALLGLSYGTKQALAYADAYPDHVERLVLDSVVLPDGPDPSASPRSPRSRRSSPPSVIEAHARESRKMQGATSRLSPTDSRRGRSPPMFRSTRLTGRRRRAGYG